MKNLVRLVVATALLVPAFGQARDKWSDALFDKHGGDLRKYIIDRCGDEESRDCFDIKDESAIIDAIVSTGQDVKLVVMGEKVIRMDEDEYYAWQGFMADHLAKAGLSMAHLVVAVPAKMISGLAVTVAGIFWSPFEKKGQIGDLTRKGLGLFTKSIGDLATDLVGTVDGVTFGGPIYVVALPFTAASVPVKEVINSTK